MQFYRLLPLPARPERSFFLWGPRLTGKTSLLKSTYPNALRIDLLQSELFARYTTEPHRLRQEILALDPLPELVIIDEVQKVPPLLDEVHWLIQEHNLVFILCGSSARKLRRGHANLLGGRALKYTLHGLVSAELGSEFDLLRVLNHGYLPLNYLDDAPAAGLRAYVTDYLKEEIAAEGLVRNLPAFSRFLDIAAITDTEIVNFSNIASDCGVSGPTAKEYFQILQDTLLGRFLPAFTKQAKRKVTQAPKFYLADVGVVNLLAKRSPLQWGSPSIGHALENWVHHELISFSHYSGLEYDLSYWRVNDEVEVDFIIGGMEIALEVKAASTVSSRHLRGLRELKKEYPQVGRRILVCNEPQRRLTNDGIEILPAAQFAADLWQRKIISEGG